MVFESAVLSTRKCAACRRPGIWLANREKRCGTRRGMVRRCTRICGLGWQGFASWLAEGGKGPGGEDVR